jgi:hypothetical protein
MAEALERLLPHCERSPHKVARWLDDHHRDDDIQLLGNGVRMTPNSNPVMLGIMAHGEGENARLYVQVRQGMNPMPPVVGIATTDPAGAFSAQLFEKHHQFWMFERAGFERHCPKHAGGRPVVASAEDVLGEIVVIAGTVGLPATVTGDGSLHEMVKDRIGSRCPKKSWFADHVGPLYKRIEAERPR